MSIALTLILSAVFAFAGDPEKSSRYGASKGEIIPQAEKDRVLKAEGEPTGRDNGKRKRPEYDKGEVISRAEKAKIEKAEGVEPSRPSDAREKAGGFSLKNEERISRAEKAAILRSEPPEDPALQAQAESADRRAEVPADASAPVETAGAPQADAPPETVPVETKSEPVASDPAAASAATPVPRGGPWLPLVMVVALIAAWLLLRRSSPLRR